MGKIPSIFRIAKGASTPYVYGPPSKQILGGKGAGLMQMVEMGLNVPPAFCITTQVCNDFMSLQTDQQRELFMGKLMADVVEYDTWLAQQVGYAPLVSVRSGAPVSMPGMMDTILNVGLTHANMANWRKRLGDRAALDSYRRLIQMLGATGYGIDMGAFDFQLARVKKDFGVKEDKDMSLQCLSDLIDVYKTVFTKNTGQSFPDTREKQLRVAISAVFNSWGNPRAIEYRKINKIDPGMGTACNVQAMVFGNLNDDSGTGVLFTRNPSTGLDQIMGEFLQNAQGEDVVAGIRTPVPVGNMLDLPAPWPEISKEIYELCLTLEKHYTDMVDVEFTVQDGVLYVLQSRVGKRSAGAAFRIAVDLVEEGVINVDDALSRLTRAQYKTVRRPSIDPGFKTEPDHVGLPACPGVATGRPVFTSEDAVNATDAVILVTHETDPDDIAGMNKAVGILTAMGGATSHAAVVARAMDKPCVVGCTALDIDALKTKMKKIASSRTARITIDGATGRVWVGTEVPIIGASDDPCIGAVQHWALAKLGHAESLDFPEDLVGPVMIHAASWWGDVAACEVVLDDLIALTPQERSLISLNVRPTVEYERAEDAVLNLCFGKVPGDEADTTFLNALDLCVLGASQDNKLAGLTIVSAYDKNWPNKAAIKANGVLFSGNAKTLADVIDGHPVAISSEFVETVCGGVDAYGTLRHWMTTAGIKTKIVLPAVPADYAVFSVLSQ